jgi:hypothetical protein
VTDNLYAIDATALSLVQVAAPIPTLSSYVLDFGTGYTGSANTGWVCYQNFAQEQALLYADAEIMTTASGGSSGITQLDLHINGSSVTASGNHSPWEISGSTTNFPQWVAITGSQPTVGVGQQLTISIPQVPSGTYGLRVVVCLTPSAYLPYIGNI